MSSVRPFPTDDQVFRRIRLLRFEDLHVVVRMHQATMGTTTWGRLGLPFLETLYGALLQHPGFLGWVYQEEGEVRGFIAGVDDARGVMTEVARHHALELALPALGGLAREPSLLSRLLLTPLYFRRSDPAEEVRAESIFCAFSLEIRGRRVSGHINKVLFDELASRGHDRVKITTEVDNPGANRQLRAWGFEDVGHFSFYGKEMVTYVLDLRHSPRVEPVAWSQRVRLIQSR